jgi:hypothetical protein
MKATGKKGTMKITIPIYGWVFVLLAVLRLCHVINWSWWIVALPIWGPIVLAVLWVLVYIWWGNV